MSKILIVTALGVELAKARLPSNVNIIYCGVGKVNAVVNTMKAINQFCPNILLNYGTAGKVSSNLSGILPVSKVVQRDMNAEPLSPRGITPFCPRPQEYYSGRDGYICGSGDSFVTSADPWLIRQSVDVVDMELFAIAVVAHEHQIPWRSYKFISDAADEQAGEQWHQRINHGEELFLQELEQLL